MRNLLLIVPLAILGGCVIRPGPYYRPYSPPPAAAPRAEVYYYGNHFIPESDGGGWCYIDGPHTHAYYPQHDDWYDYDQGYYWYRGPFMFAFLGGHPLPGGGWCFINGVHQHDYPPPRGTDWRWSRGSYVYEGQYRPFRPPPASYWPRPAPRTNWLDRRPTVRPSPMRPRPNDRLRSAPGLQRQEPERRGPPAWNERGAPGRDERPGASGFAPGHRENSPPGHGGVPPGQVGRPEPEPRVAPAWNDRGSGRDERPGASGFAPGHGDNPPPGHGGTPPGQLMRPEQDRRGGPGFVPPGRDEGRRGTFTPPGRDDRGSGRAQPSVERPTKSQPAASGNAPDKKQKRERDEKDDDSKRNRRR